MPKSKPKGRRVTSLQRAQDLRMFLAAIQEAGDRYGFRIESEDVGRNLAIFDEREERPATWPVVAFAESIGAKVKGLNMQSIMPTTMEE